MNCIPGDLAVIVNALSPNRDRIVRCVRLLLPGEEMTLAGVTFVAVADATFWAVEGRLKAAGPCGEEIEVPGGPIRDRWLRPIRDPGPDAVDESLLWLRIPEFDTV